MVLANNLFFLFLGKLYFSNLLAVAILFMGLTSVLYPGYEKQMKGLQEACLCQII